MDKVELIGRLARDPMIRESQGENQMLVARYTLAVDRSRGSNANGENAADFISCVAFRHSAEFAQKYLHKGSKIAVIGHIQTGSYTNRDGQKVFTTDVIVEEQEFAGSRSENRTPEPAASSPEPVRDSQGFADYNGNDEDTPFH